MSATHPQFDWDQSVENAWTGFSQNLCAQIANLGDDDNILIETLGQDLPGGCRPYVQIASFADGAARRLEVSSNAYLAPAYELSEDAEAELECAFGFDIDRDPLGEPLDNFYLMVPAEQAMTLGRVAVQVLREHFGVIHPTMCTLSVGAPLAQAVMPDIAQFEPLDIGAAHPIANDWDIAVMIHRTLHALLGESVERDDDGDWVLHLPNQAATYVSLVPGRPMVRLWSCPVHQIKDHDSALREVNILNRDSPWARHHILNHATLVSQIELWVQPFVPMAVQQALATLGAGCLHASKDFADRTGGVTR